MAYPLPWASLGSVAMLEGAGCVTKEPEARSESTAIAGLSAAPCDGWEWWIGTVVRVEMDASRFAGCCSV